MTFKICASIENTTQLITDVLNDLRREETEVSTCTSVILENVVST